MTEVDDIGGKPPLGALFSTDASDNAEVVPPSAPRGPESMWSTEAPAAPPEADDEPPRAPAFGTGDPAPSTGWPDPDTLHDALQDDTLHSDPIHDDPTQDHATQDRATQDSVHSLWDRAVVVEEGPFSAEPVARDDDVIDAADLFDPLHDDASAWNPAPASGSVFSSGTARRPTPPRVDDSPWTVLDEEWDEPAPAARPGRAAPTDAHPRDRAATPPPAPPTSPAWTEHPPASGPAPSEPISDPHGLEAAVARLTVTDQERAAVAIAVCGALLEPDELVAGVVTGQMLGRPAAVTVTDRRVIIANDRRWQPLVDVYRIDSKLVVRGRHDRQVAALSFADTTRLSMIDGITEVELAIALADRIRDSEPLD